MTGQQEGRRPVTGRRNRRALAGPMAVIALVGVALTVLSSLAARDGTVSAPERSVFEAINGMPDWLERPMWAFQLLGVLVTPVLIAVVLLVLRRWRPALALLLLVPLKLVAERQVLKQLVERQRPGQTVDRLEHRPLGRGDGAVPGGEGGQHGQRDADQRDRGHRAGQRPAVPPARHRPAAILLPGHRPTAIATSRRRSRPDMRTAAADGDRSLAVAGSRTHSAPGRGSGSRARSGWWCRARGVGSIGGLLPRVGC